MTQQSEPLVLTVEHLRAAKVPNQAIKRFAEVFKTGMPITVIGLVAATTGYGTYLAAIDHFRNKRGVGREELNKIATDEFCAIHKLRMEYATKKREALAAAIAEAVRKLPKTNPLLDVEP